MRSMICLLAVAFVIPSTLTFASEESFKLGTFEHDGEEIIGIVLSTGTPSGVGMARTPPIYMKPGDIAECSVEGIGTLRNPIRMWSDEMRH